MWGEEQSGSDDQEFGGTSGTRGLGIQPKRPSASGGRAREQVDFWNESLNQLPSTPRSPR